MSDETQTEQTTAPEINTPTPVSSGNAGATFTQADIDRIVTERLSRERKAQEEEGKKREERAKLDAAAQAKAEKEDAEKERDEAVQKARLAGYRADLKGEVVDVTAALKLIDDEKHVKDGAVDVKSLLKDFPFLAPAKASAPGAGGVQGSPAPDARSSLTAAMAADGINLNG